MWQPEQPATGAAAGRARRRRAPRRTTNNANMLVDLERFEEAKSLLCKSMPAARRVLGEGNLITLWFMSTYAESLYKDNGATLDDFREAVTTLEDTERIARRVLGSAPPTTLRVEDSLRNSRAALRARETPSTSAPGRLSTRPS